MLLWILGGALGTYLVTELYVKPKLVQAKNNFLKDLFSQPPGSLDAPASAPSAPVKPVNASTIDGIDSFDLIPVTLNGETWLVTPGYDGPIGINEAAIKAKSLGMELPSPALVDAIWKQADLKLLPMPRANVISQAVFDDQKRKIEAQIAGRSFKLMAGAFKDTVNVNGHHEIYGWHVEDGKTIGVPLVSAVTPNLGAKVVQPPSGKHHDLPGPIGFKDYAGGARYVKKAEVA